MKSIVISDIHNRVNWIESWLSQQSYDEVIFLGDYFDNFHDTLFDTHQTAQWLQRSLTLPKRVHLFGNHDVYYCFGIPNLVCSGNTQQKYATIFQIMKPSDWQQLKWFHFSQNFLFSHAGIHEDWALHPLKGFDIQHLKDICRDADVRLKARQVPRLLVAGWGRGGQERIGGIIWLDYDVEFKPIPNVHQILGHTPHSSPLGKGIYKPFPNKKNSISNNYDVDFANRWITIVEDGVVKFDKNPFFK